jgi:tetratricopeptide (TPR) repeat protein
MKNSDRDFFKRRPAIVISVAVGLCLVAFAVVWVRAFYGSMHAHRQGEAYLEKQQYIKAITFFDRSIHWYTPFNPYISKSAQHLWEIGVKAEQQGDIQLALIAVRTIRRGFLGARSFYVPGEHWISKCDRKIVSLMAKGSGGQDMKGNTALSFSTQKSQEPDVFWTLILEVGLLGWIGSAIGFLMYGLAKGQTPKLRSRSAIFWGVMIIIFYTLWIVGMVKA